MCVDFLMNAHHLFWMKIQHSNRIFQVSERCFYSPTQRIQSFQFFRRIFIHIQTCEYRFIISRCYFKPYNSEIYLIKPCLFRFFGVWRQKIKCETSFSSAESGKRKSGFCSQRKWNAVWHFTWHEVSGKNQNRRDICID